MKFLTCRQLSPGVEFVLSHTAEPVLYVIKRQYRQSPESTIQQAFYYVYFGSVYQAPTLAACLRARTNRCSHQLGVAFRKLKSDLEPLAWRQRQRAKRLRRSGMGSEPYMPQALQSTATTADAVASAAVGTREQAGGAAPQQQEDADKVADSRPLDPQDASHVAVALQDAMAATVGALPAATEPKAGPQSSLATACTVPAPPVDPGVEKAERQAAQGMAQQPAVTVDSWHWMKRSDDVILNVLGRCASELC